MQVEYQFVSYKEFSDEIIIEGDYYDYAKRSLSIQRRRAFLNNPFLNDLSSTALILAKVNGKIVGKRMVFPTRIKASGDIINAVSGSNYVVNKNYRRCGVGAALIMYSAKKANNFMLSAGCSNASLKIYKALKANCFLFEQLESPRHVFTPLEYLSFKSIVKFLYSPIINIIPFLAITKEKKQAKRLMSLYHIKKSERVPEWVNELLRHDEHKYMEIHDREWLQWNLDHSFDDGNLGCNQQTFYEIWKGDEPYGYFMTTIRKMGKKMVGSVVEWQTKDDDLKESDIYILAASYAFSKNVNAIRIASCDESTISIMKKLSFRRSGFANIVFKDLNKKYDDINDISKWRIRMGYADSIMS